MAAALVIAVVAAGLVAAAVLDRQFRERSRAFTRGREPLSESGFAALFPSSLEGEVGVSIRALLERWVAVDVALLRPGDAFCKDLLLDARDGLDPEEFLRAVEGRWRVSVPREEAEHILTIAQLASAVARLRSSVQA